jgi:transcriptional regulator with PAS, ATPase and Fis domain
MEKYAKKRGAGLIMSGANAENRPHRIVHGEGLVQTTKARNMPMGAAQCSPECPEDTLIGCSEAFVSLLDTIRSIATRQCCITLVGETGTGKEMLARKIHQCSDRKDKVFIPVDCTTLTGSLFESQLFGHVKGAFTGATDNTMGFFRAADGGTIFLDEISEIPLELQAKLLRVLQQGAVTPLGATQPYAINVRVICATNRDLRQMVTEQDFRADLYYRLNVVTLHVPPLRQRTEDVLPMAVYFLKNLSRFYNEPLKTLSPQVEKILLEYPWPGNARQLANAMERAYVLTEASTIQTETLPPEILVEKRAGTGSALLTLEAAKERLVIEALRRTKGQKNAAARILGIDRRRLNRIIEKLNIEVSQIRKD